MSGSTTSTTFTYTGHTVTYTVPETGLYDLTAAGAKGGNGAQTYGAFGISFGSSSGGPGALIGGDLELTQGEVLTIAVGGVGANGPNEVTNGYYGIKTGGPGGGGGGGSFVVGPGNAPLVIAGGGGGGGGRQNEDKGQSGLIRTAGGSIYGGTDGSGGQVFPGGGGGFKGAGAGPLGGGGYPGLQGGAYDHGAGSAYDGFFMGLGGGRGGFGGGGGGGGGRTNGRDSGREGAGGGGGGYSGGAGGSEHHEGGFGGGSYLAPGAIDPVKVEDQNQGAGEVTISLVSAAAVVSPPMLLKPVLTYTVAEGQTLQGLYGDILANTKAADPGDQASLTISSIGEAGTAGFLYPDLAHQTLTYTADGYDPQRPTDSFTYTVTGPGGSTVTGTMDVAVTAGADLPTKVGTAGPDTLGTNAVGSRLLGLDGNDRLEVNGPDSLAFGGRGDDIIQLQSILASGSTVYGGPGTNTVVISQATAPKDVSLVLQQGGVDQVTGFSVQNGDVLDLRQALAESQLNLGGDFGKLSSYARVIDNDGNARLLLYPGGITPGGSAGIPLAELYGLGPSTHLATLINDHALRIT